MAWMVSIDLLLFDVAVDKKCR